MAIYTHLPLYKDSYALLLAVTQLMPHLPKDCRYTIGQDLRKKIMNIVILIYRANRTKNKVEFIRKMREELLETQVYIRLMCDLHYISEARYALLAEQTVGMSKQMTAWEKSESKKQRAIGTGRRSTMLGRTVITGALHRTRTMTTTRTTSTSIVVISTGIGTIATMGTLSAPFEKLQRIHNREDLSVTLYLLKSSCCSTYIVPTRTHVNISEEKNIS